MFENRIVPVPAAGCEHGALFIDCGLDGIGLIAVRMFTALGADPPVVVDNGAICPDVPPAVVPSPVFNSVKRYRLNG